MSSLFTNIITMKLFAPALLTMIFFGPASAQDSHVDLKITHLKDSFFVYTTYQNYGGNPFPSNSMYLVTSEGIVLFDTPWDSTQFQPLADSLMERHGKKVVLCIATHFHDDRTAGLEFYRRQGAATYTSLKTRTLCRKHNMKEPKFIFVNDTVFSMGGYRFEAYYPGWGHSEDNIVVWFPSAKILYGGCLIKSVENSSMGNIADANLESWPDAIEKLKRRFHGIEWVIPGHFAWSGKEALDHTLKLVKQAKKK